MNYWSLEFAKYNMMFKWISSAPNKLQIAYPD